MYVIYIIRSYIVPLPFSNFRILCRYLLRNFDVAGISVLNGDELAGNSLLFFSQYSGLKFSAIWLQKIEIFAIKYFVFGIRWQ